MDGYEKSVDGQTDEVLALNDPELHTDHLQLFREVMKTSGEAAQTFAALRRLAQKGQTFASVPKVSEISMLPRRTTQIHLTKLCEDGWIRHEGRHGRRTATYSLNLKRLGPKPLFAKLPRAFASPRRREFAAWSTRAVLAVMISQDMLPEQIEMQDYGCLDGREFVRTTFIAKATGLSQKSVLRAVNLLAWHGFLVIYDPDTDYQKTFEVGLNHELFVKESAVPPRVAGRDKPALLRREPKAPKPGKDTAGSGKTGTGLGVISHGQTCAGRQDKPALEHTQTCAEPGQTCAVAGTKLRQSRDKPALAVSENLLVRSSSKNPLTRTSYKETLGQNMPASRHAVSDHEICVDQERDRQLADHLFSKMGYTDKDGAIVFVACAWVHANCGVALMDLVDAAQGVRECNPRDAMCYFRANLIGRITKAKFDELWDRTKHPKPGDWGPSNCEPAPRRGKQERMGDVTEQIVNRIIPKEEADERHAELRRQIQHARLA